MDKNEIEIFLKKILNSLTDVKVFNDRSRKDSIYPYIVADSSNINTQLYPRVDVDLVLNVWDKSQNYIKVNEIADIIQSALNRNSIVADNITINSPMRITAKNYLKGTSSGSSTSGKKKVNLIK